MKVFLSWSGDKSRAVADALRDWLPRVINEIEPFMSKRDIAAGANWQTEIAGQLETSKFGIVCVTAENQESRWLNFEAGALAKEVGASWVAPLAIDLTVANIEPPLGQFQAKGTSKDEILELLQSVNKQCTKPLRDEVLRDSCDQWWPRLEAKLKDIEARHRADSSDQSPERSERDLLEEILTTVRALQAITPARVSASRNAVRDELRRRQTVQAALSEWSESELRPLLPDDALIILPSDDTSDQPIVIATDVRLEPEAYQAVSAAAKRVRLEVNFITDA